MRVGIRIGYLVEMCDGRMYLAFYFCTSRRTEVQWELFCTVEVWLESAKYCAFSVGF